MNKTVEKQGFSYFRTRINYSMRFSYLFTIILGSMLIASCGGDENPNRGKPIVMGDPNTIVTEADSQYLQDFAPDINMVAKQAAPEPAPADTTGQAAAQPAQQETAQPAPQQQETPAKEETPKQALAATGKGLNIPFKEVTVFIPDISTRSYKQQNPQNANGATYELTDGSLGGNQLKVSGGTVTKVSMRYQVAVMVKNELGTLPLDALSSSGNWEVLKGKNNIYTIPNLDPKHLKGVNPSPAAIRNAVARAARSKRMNKKTQQKWESSVRNVRSVNQKPMVVKLRSVMWKIEGKDKNGKPFQKQVRLDIPL